MLVLAAMRDISPVKRLRCLAEVRRCSLDRDNKVTNALPREKTLPIHIAAPSLRQQAGPAYWIHLTCPSLLH